MKSLCKPSKRIFTNQASVIALGPTDTCTGSLSFSTCTGISSTPWAKKQGIMGIRQQEQDKFHSTVVWSQWCSWTKLAYLGHQQFESCPWTDSKSLKSYTYKQKKNWLTQPFSSLWGISCLEIKHESRSGTGDFQSHLVNSHHAILAMLPWLRWGRKRKGKK